MNKNKETSSFSWSQFRSRFFMAPVEIRVYAVFITLFGLLAHGLVFIVPRELTQTIFFDPGGSASMGYFFSLFWVGYFIYTKDLRARIVPILMLVLFIGFFVLKQIIVGDIHFKNWSSRDNLVLLLWNLLIPFVWIGMLLSPRIRRFCQRASPSNEQA